MFQAIHDPRFIFSNNRTVDQLPARPDGTSRIIVHHTAGGNNGNHLGTGSAANLHNANRNGGGVGIPYNFYIESGAGTGSVDGRIVLGRGWNAQGAHTALPGGTNFNTHSLGIALQGNFHYAPATRPTEAQTRALVSLLGHIFAVWPSLRNVMGNHGGHRDMPGHSSNACPGQHFHGQVRHLLNCGRDFVSVVNALNTLRSRGIISDVNYWRDNFHLLEHLNTLIIRFGNTSVANAQVRNFTNARDAINHIANRGIIDRPPTHWLNNYSRVRFLNYFFIQFANRIS